MATGQETCAGQEFFVSAKKVTNGNRSGDLRQARNKYLIKNFLLVQRKLQMATGQETCTRQGKIVQCIL